MCERGKTFIGIATSTRNLNLKAKKENAKELYILLSYEKCAVNYDVFICCSTWT
jgi:hypothetical protein